MSALSIFLLTIEFGIFNILSIIFTLGLFIYSTIGIPSVSFSWSGVKFKRPEKNGGERLQAGALIAYLLNIFTQSMCLVEVGLLVPLLASGSLSATSIPPQSPMTFSLEIISAVNTQLGSVLLLIEMCIDVAVLRKFSILSTASASGSEQGKPMTKMFVDRIFYTLTGSYVICTAYFHYLSFYFMGTGFRNIYSNQISFYMVSFWAFCSSIFDTTLNIWLSKKLSLFAALRLPSLSPNAKKSCTILTTRLRGLVYTLICTCIIIWMITIVSFLTSGTDPVGYAYGHANTAFLGFHCSVQMGSYTILRDIVRSLIGAKVSAGASGSLKKPASKKVRNFFPSKKKALLLSTLKTKKHTDPKEEARKRYSEVAANAFVSTNNEGDVSAAFASTNCGESVPSVDAVQIISEEATPGPTASAMSDQLQEE